MIGEEKGSVAISGRSSHKMTGLFILAIVSCLTALRGVFYAL